MKVIRVVFLVRPIQTLIFTMILHGFYLFTGIWTWVGIWLLWGGKTFGALFVIGGFWPLILAILITKRLYSRIFFEKEYVGIEPTSMVQWDDEQVRFSGALYELSVSPEDVLSYWVPFGLASDNFVFTLWVTVKVAEKVKTIILSQFMPDKIKFVDFLDTLDISNKPAKRLFKLYKD